MLKEIGYRLFAFVYYMFRLFPIKRKQVLCITTHDDGGGSNADLTVRALKDLGEGYQFTYITKRETLDIKGLKSLPGLFSFFLKKPYELARAQIILLDNVFLPMAYLKMRKSVKVVQLWHGTGTIKRFGQHVNTGRLKELEYRANQNITHLIVNSEEIAETYSGAFGVDRSKVYPIGLPKTDELIRFYRDSQRKDEHNKDIRDDKNIDDKNINNKDIIINRKKALYRKYQIPLDKKLVLYAPTFRDKEKKNSKVIELAEEMIRELPEEYVLGLRLHPFVAERYNGNKLSSGIYQMSFEPDLNTLLISSDVLITDYSSVIFEYCITDQPMIFLAYDLEEFSESGRGFYYPYEEYAPGPVVHSGKEAAQVIREKAFENEKIRRFRQRNFGRLDGKSTDRLIEILQNP